MNEVRVYRLVILVLALIVSVNVAMASKPEPPKSWVCRGDPQSVYLIECVIRGTKYSRINAVQYNIEIVNDGREAIIDLSPISHRGP